MSFCPQCGTKVEADWIHCPNCKYYLAERIEPSISHLPQRSQEKKKVEKYLRREEFQEVAMGFLSLHSPCILSKKCTL